MAFIDANAGSQVSLSRSQGFCRGDQRTEGLCNYMTRHVTIEGRHLFSGYRGRDRIVCVRVCRKVISKGPLRTNLSTGMVEIHDSQTFDMIKTGFASVVCQ